MKLIASHLPLIAVLGFAALAVGAEPPKYSKDVSRWVEVKVPPTSRAADHAVWFYSANYAKLAWRVYTVEGRVEAQLVREEWNPLELARPPFATKTERFRECYVAERVDDGWLVGFNEGEWGGALYWYSHDGTESYKISNAQIVAFFRLPSGWHAVEGCGHMGLNDGSVIRIERAVPHGKWSARTIAKLPDAPETASVRSDRKVVIVGADTLMVLGSDDKVRTLVADAPWSAQYTNSSVLSADERKLYFGMRQYVAEYNFASGKVRLLVPSKAFLNRLPKEEEARIRKFHTRPELRRR